MKVRRWLLDKCCAAPVLFNVVVGYMLFRLGKVTSGDDLALVIFFAGIAAISSILSVRFASKQAA
jgi:hypothetical protein